MFTVSAFQKAYSGKRVLVLGHTGFKGAWLSLWLAQMGADLAGFSKDMPSEPCLFKVLNLKKKMRHDTGDIRNHNQLAKVFRAFKPEIVFHLAAQPIVRTAYREPKLTFDTNSGGTVNVLECIRQSPTVKAAVIITSDKCYENYGINRGYREDDRLGGEDPYSASKACAEIAFSAYFRSYFFQKLSPMIATARAGNVIGGGDWASDRIVPDCVRAWSSGKVAMIRSPHSTRPWQHVLEPVSGYLWLGACLLQKKSGLTGSSFNFGPRHHASRDVKSLVDLFLSFWGAGSWNYIPSNGKKEARLLKLSPRKTAETLFWKTALSFADTVKFTALWYQKYYSKKIDMTEFSLGQIESYIQKARNQELPWAGGVSYDRWRSAQTVENYS
ncbi:MAG: CDP-glucose 4,6-dehydratase [Candidatus Omnitrophica bacterium]|nr:CDP-glucose 4,6-dehydratase [Candidatus Omnitrophota bacterium]